MAASPKTKKKSHAFDVGPDAPPVLKWAARVFEILISLKFAVLVMVFLTLGLIVATVMESVYDTPTAQFWVYRALWFRFVLFLFGLLILCVAISRWPWKRHHSAFLLAHAGILLLLFGSWLTDRFGLDGTLRIEEGKLGTVVEINQPLLIFSEGGQVKTFPIQWIPPHVDFRGKEIPEYGVKVDQFLSHADPEISFVPSEERSTQKIPAMKLKVQGGPMRITQEFWLWAGSAGWSRIQAGPATLVIEAEGLPKPLRNVDQILEDVAAESRGPRFVLKAMADGSAAYEARSSDGKIKKGKLPAGKIVGQEIDPGWKGGVKLTVTEWVPDASAHAEYRHSKIQYGNQAPPSAIHLTAGKGGKGSELWLGLGERALLQVQGREVSVAYFPQRFVLPFGILLNRFQIDHYEGTRDPSAYSSKVTVVEGSTHAGTHEISMNEPLEHQGITFYQASYEDGEPRPTVTILSVNRDPGRWSKYIGSLLIVVGSILLFAQRFRKARAAPKKAPAHAPTAEEVFS